MIGSKAYLSLCATYRDAATYLKEWVEFHRLVGVERFFLYNNGSGDEHREILAPYIEAGIAVLHEWPLPFFGGTGRPAGTMRAFDHCIDAHRADSRWIAFLDIDEFLFSPEVQQLPPLLAEYEQWPGIVVSRAEYGTSAHVERPPGLVIENYVHRLKLGPDSHAYTKNIVDPMRVVRCASVHHFVFEDGLPVTEDGRPVEMLIRPERIPVAYSRLRINHYGLKSEEEMSRKLALWEETDVERHGPASARLMVPDMYERDEALSPYLPAVRKAVGLGA